MVAAVARDAATPLDVNELRAAMRGSLAGYKVPKRIRVVDRIPRLPNGKVDYPDARTLAARATTQTDAEGAAR